MNDEISGVRVRLRRAVLPVVAAGVAIAFLATACGGGGDPSAASTTAATTIYQKELAYAQCVREHGVPNFPDPNSQGQLGVNANTIGVSEAVVQSAENDCKSLLPNSGKRTPAQEKQELAGALKYAQCMRSHGILEFPDPTDDNGHVGFAFTNSRSLNPSSPQFQAAQNSCQKDLVNPAQ
jgi:hypothetical protein